MEETEIEVVITVHVRGPLPPLPPRVERMSLQLQTLVNQLLQQSANAARNGTGLPGVDSIMPQMIYDFLFDCMSRYLTFNEIIEYVVAFDRYGRNDTFLYGYVAKIGC